MDLNLLRSIVTLLSLIAFIGIVVWAYRRSNRAQFDEAAVLPLADENRTPQDKTRSSAR